MVLPHAKMFQRAYSILSQFCTFPEVWSRSTVAATVLFLCSHLHSGFSKLHRPALPFTCIFRNNWQTFPSESYFCWLEIWYHVSKVVYFLLGCSFLEIVHLRLSVSLSGRTSRMEKTSSAYDSLSFPYQKRNLFKHNSVATTVQLVAQLWTWSPRPLPGFCRAYAYFLKLALFHLLLIKLGKSHNYWNINVFNYGNPVLRRIWHSLL